MISIILKTIRKKNAFFLLLTACKKLSFYIILYCTAILDDDDDYDDDECAADSSYQLTISRGDGVKYWTGSLLLLSFLCNQIIRRGVSFEALREAQREESTAIN